MLTLLRAALWMGMFLSWEKEIQKHGAKLPHWQQDQGTQFVTFRLGDALPLVRTRQWREERLHWLEEHPEPWSPETEQEYHRTFTARLEKWLDQGMGCCLFREAGARQVLEVTLLRFQGSREQDHTDRADAFMEQFKGEIIVSTQVLWEFRQSARFQVFRHRRDKTRRGFQNSKPSG